MPRKRRLSQGLRLRRTSMGRLPKRCSTVVFLRPGSSTCCLTCTTDKQSRCAGRTLRILSRSGRCSNHSSPRRTPSHLPARRDRERCRKSFPQYAVVARQMDAGAGAAMAPLRFEQALAEILQCLFPFSGQGPDCDGGRSRRDATCEQIIRFVSAAGERFASESE